MSNSKDISTRAMVRHWRRVGPLLEEVRRRELRALNGQALEDTIDCLLDLGALIKPKSTVSGLVEQQRRFRKLWQ